MRSQTCAAAPGRWDPGRFAAQFAVRAADGGCPRSVAERGRQVIAYAGEAGETWLEASAWQARGLARAQPSAAFSDWEQAVTRFVLAGDMMHASNVRYMLAARAVEAGQRLADVPVWLRDCEAFAASRGYQHELAHIHRVQAVYHRIQGDLAAARPLLGDALPVFRQAGDFRCTSKTLLEIAEHHLPGDPGAAASLLVQSLPMAALAADSSLHARILAALISAAGAAGDLPLAARALGALDATSEQPPAGGAGPAPDVPAELARTLRGPAYATFLAEGKAGGTELITTRYPRLAQDLPGTMAA